jgi:S1-C subfamily serine protease
MFAEEQAWAEKFSLGPLELTDVLIEEAADRIFSARLPDYAGTLGLEALKRLDLIVDGKHGIAYLRPKQTTSAPGDHNRLGAVFVPRDDQSDDLVARVLDGSPAFEGGIRNGDVLLSVGGRDVTTWRTDPGDPYNWAFESPAGTALELTVKRGDLTFKATVLLREILKPLQ